MPITQERMISLIISARAWQKAWTETHFGILQNVKFYQNGEITEADLIANIITLKRETTPEISAVTPLIAEERYFQQNRARNDAAARRAAGKRVEAGAKPQMARINEAIKTEDGPSLDQIDRLLKDAAKPENQDYSKPIPGWQRPEAGTFVYETAPPKTTIQSLTPTKVKRSKKDGTSVDFAATVEKNPELKDINTAPPPDLSDLFK